MAVEKNSNGQRTADLVRDAIRIARELAALDKAREQASRAQTALFQTAEPQTINH